MRKRNKAFIKSSNAFCAKPVVQAETIGPCCRSSVEMWNSKDPLLQVIGNELAAEVLAMTLEGKGVCFPLFMH